MLKICFSLLGIHSLLALTTFSVTQNSDNNPGGTGDPGDLRFNLNAMNQILNSTPDDCAVIFASPMTIQLNGLLPIINNSSNPVNITIGNPGSIPTVTIDGNTGSYSGFFVPMGNVTIQNMIFQNLTAKGGNGGDGNSGGGGGMGAGGAIYAPATFLDGSTPSITLMNVSIQNCSAVGGNGGNYFSISPTGDEGGGGGGGFWGDGGSVTTNGSTGGGGGGGFGGNGGDATLSNASPLGGGGGGGGGIGSRAALGTPTNLGTGGSDEQDGFPGSNYYLSITAGSGSGGHVGGIDAGGGGGGNLLAPVGNAGGGGGGSRGMDGHEPIGSTPPGGGITASGGVGGDGGGGGGGGVVAFGTTNTTSGEAGSGGYGGGGGGGAGSGSSDPSYTVQGGAGGVGGGGGGGGADLSGSTLSDGGNSQGGGGGGGGGPSSSSPAPGGTDTGKLGGGSGGSGAGSFGPGSGGGGGGGGSGLGPAIFVDSGLTLKIQAFPGITTTFSAANNIALPGLGGNGGPDSSPGNPGSFLGDCIFLRENSSLSLVAEDSNDLLILSDQVSFVDDTSFGGTGTRVNVTGNGTVTYNGTSHYQGTIKINNANFKVNGVIDQADISVCRDIGFSTQRGTLSGSGLLTGNVFANSGTISPDTAQALVLGQLTLSPADPMSNTLGSLVHIEINPGNSSLVGVLGSASLAGILEIDINPSATPGTYTVLAASSISGTFDSVSFTNATPTYLLSYLPIGSPTFVQFEFFFPSESSLRTKGLSGNNLKVANYLNLLIPEEGALGLTDQISLLNRLSFSDYENALESISPARNSIPAFTAQNLMFLFSKALDSRFTKERFSYRHKQNRFAKETSFLAAAPSPRQIMYAPQKNTQSQIWSAGFGEFGSQNAQDQTPSFQFNSGGFLIAYDYGNIEEGCIGLLAGYAHAAMNQHQSMGSNEINAGYFSVYGMKFFSDFFIDAALWGECMGVDQKRNISYPGFQKTAKSSYTAGQFDVHFGAGWDYTIRSGTIEPFALLDWVAEWDPSYAEKGAFPYNMKISSRNSWMFRFEAGLNGYNTTTFSWGTFVARGKLSYVYKDPNDIGHLKAAILGAPASFTVETFTSSQNLISPALEFFWQTNWRGYWSLIYEGEYGSGYKSTQFYGKIGYSF